MNDTDERTDYQKMVDYLFENKDNSPNDWYEGLNRLNENLGRPYDNDTLKTFVTNFRRTSQRSKRFW